MSAGLLLPFLAPAVFGLVAIIAGWLYYSVRSAASDSPPGRLYRCGGCGEVYAGQGDRPMSRCPRCGRLNEAVRH